MKCCRVSEQRSCRVSYDVVIVAWRGLRKGIGRLFVYAFSCACRDKDALVRQVMAFYCQYKRTDIDGTVVFNSDGHSLVMETEK